MGEEPEAAPPGMEAIDSREAIHSVGAPAGEARGEDIEGRERKMIRV